MNWWDSGQNARSRSRRMVRKRASGCMGSAWTQIALDTLTPGV